jgi:hypothetical protein
MAYLMCGQPVAVWAQSLVATTLTAEIRTKTRALLQVATQRVIAIFMVCSFWQVLPVRVSGTAGGERALHG